MNSRPTKPRKLPQQTRSRETVELILEGAAQVFERHGYAAGTTNRIADRAGVSVGSVYQYFPNKDAILVGLASRHIEDSLTRLAPILQSAHDTRAPLRPTLTGLLDELADIHRQQPDLHRVLFEESPRPTQLREQLDEFEVLAVAAFAAYLAVAPDVAVDDLWTAARIVATVLESVTHRIAISNVTDDEWQRTADSVVTMLVCHLSRTTP